MASVAVQNTTTSAPFGFRGKMARAGNRLWLAANGSADGTNPGLCLWYSDNNGGSWTKHSQIDANSALAFDIAVDDVNTPGALYVVVAAGNATAYTLTFYYITSNVGTGVPGAASNTQIDAGGTNLGNRLPCLVVTNTATNPRVWVFWSKQTTATTYVYRGAYAAIGSYGTWTQPTGFDSIMGFTSGSFNAQQMHAVSVKIAGNDRLVLFLYNSDSFAAGSRRWQSIVINPTLTTPTLGSRNDVLIVTYTLAVYDVAPALVVEAIDDYIVVGVVDDTNAQVTWLKSTNGTTFTTPTGWGAITMGRPGLTKSGSDFWIIASATFGDRATTAQTLQYRKITSATDTLGSATTFSDTNGNGVAVPRDTGTARIFGAYRSATSSPYTVRFDSVLLSQTIRPDGTVSSGAWTTAPLFSKINDASDATTIQAVAS